MHVDLDRPPVVRNGPRVERSRSSRSCSRSALTSRARRARASTSSNRPGPPSTSTSMDVCGPRSPDARGRALDRQAPRRRPDPLASATRACPRAPLHRVRSAATSSVRRPASRPSRHPDDLRAARRALRVRCRGDVGHRRRAGKHPSAAASSGRTALRRLPRGQTGVRDEREVVARRRRGETEVGPATALDATEDRRLGERPGCGLGDAHDDRDLARVVPWPVFLIGLTTTRIFFWFARQVDRHAGALERARVAGDGESRRGRGDRDQRHGPCGVRAGLDDLPTRETRRLPRRGRRRVHQCFPLCAYGHPSGRAMIVCHGWLSAHNAERTNLTRPRARISPESDIWRSTSTRSSTPCPSIRGTSPRSRAVDDVGSRRALLRARQCEDRRRQSGEGQHAAVLEHDDALAGLCVHVANAGSLPRHAAPPNSSATTVRS